MELAGRRSYSIEWSSLLRWDPPVQRPLLAQQLSSHLLRQRSPQTTDANLRFGSKSPLPTLVQPLLTFPWCTLAKGGSPPFPLVRSVPGEGLEPSRGKPSQDFKSWKWDFQVPFKYGELPSLLNRYLGLSWLERAGVSWSEFAAGTLRAQPLKPLRICSFAEYLSKYS